MFPWENSQNLLFSQSLMDYWKGIKMDLLPTSLWLTSKRKEEKAKSDTRLRNGPNFLCMECDFSKLPKCLQMFTEAHQDVRTHEMETG